MGLKEIGEFISAIGKVITISSILIIVVGFFLCFFFVGGDTCINKAIPALLQLIVDDATSIFSLMASVQNIPLIGPFIVLAIVYFVFIRPKK